MAVFAVMGFSVATTLSRLPTVRDALGISDGQVGLFIAAFSIGAIVGLLVSSPLLHRLGSKRMVLIWMPLGGLVLIVIGVAADALRSYPLLLAAIAVFGATVSLSDVSLNVSGSANERALGRTVMPYFHAGYSIGYVLGAAVSAGAEAVHVPLWLHCAIVGLVCFATPFIAARWVPAGHETAEERAPRAARRRVWLDPRTWAIGLIVFGFAYAEGGATDWLPLAVVDERGFGNAEAAALLSVFMIAVAIGRLVGPRLVDRFGRAAVLLVECALAFIALAFVIYLPVHWVVWAACVVWGLGCALGFPLGMSAAGDDPALAAARVSAVSIIGYTAYLVGPSLVGFVAQYTGVLLALNIVLALIVLAAIMVPFARRRPVAPVDAFADPATSIGGGR